MDKNVYVWSCNRRNFAQIVVVGEYRERLLYKSNSEWFLVIKPVKSKEVYNNFGRKYTTKEKLEIYLSRKGGLKTITVNANVIQNKNFPFTKELIFPAGSQTLSIITVYWESIENYQLDVVLVFNETNITEGSLDESFQISRLNDLSNDMQSMLTKEHLSDVTIKCDSFTMKVHKNVLSARSPVFEAMFKTQMLESKGDPVVIKDMEPEVCRAMLTFLYSGQIKNLSSSNIYGLLYAAEKYQIKDLKSGCVEYLKSIMSDENALQILEVADLYDGELKTIAMDFIRNRFDQVKISKDWEFFKSKYPLLTLEIYSFLDQTI